MTPLRAAFVMEQTLGHVTHYRNLRETARERTDISATWLPIPYEVSGVARAVPFLRSNWSVRASWRARRALASALAAQPHDAVFFHTQVTALFSLAVLRRLPSVVSLDATPINYDSVGRYYGHRPAGGGPLDRERYRMNRRVFHAAARLVTWSEWARTSLIEDYGVDPSRVWVIAPGAGPAFFEIGQRREGATPDRSAGERPARLLFVGGDFRRKGGQLLLECMRAGLDERCELHLVTKDDVAPQRNVHVHRDLEPNSPGLLQLFADADVFVLPSMAECLAVVLMEAGAAGLPVLATEVGALREAVLPGESGTLVPAGDARSLRLALEALLDDPWLRWRMGRAAYGLARRKFDARANNDMLLDLVVEAACTRARPRSAA